MAAELSSNWKKLQATLNQRSEAKSAPKRKTLPSGKQLDSANKKRRLNDKLARAQKSLSSDFRGINTMGMGQSSSFEEPVEKKAAPSASLALWAEDNGISAKDLEEAYGGDMKDTAVKGAKVDKINAGLNTDVEIGKYVGIDCEMVGVGGEEDRSVLARVSIVNFHGTQVYDSFVRPKEFVTDWRTHVSGVSSKDMATARSFEAVQEEVAAVLKDRILIGHAVKNDLEAMILGHPKKDIRDTSKFPGFRKYSSGRTPSLKKLAKEILGVDIQGGQHSSIEDARATMLLFRRHKSAFDVDHAKRFPTTTPGSSVATKKKKKGKR